MELIKYLLPLVMYSNLHSRSWWIVPVQDVNKCFYASNGLQVTRRMAGSNEIYMNLKSMTKA